jgi:hypothetical protein
LQLRGKVQAFNAKEPTTANEAWINQKSRAAAVRKKLECMLFNRSRGVATKFVSSFSSSDLRTIAERVINSTFQNASRSSFTRELDPLRDETGAEHAIGTDCCDLVN